MAQKNAGKNERRKGRNFDRMTPKKMEAFEALEASKAFFYDTSHCTPAILGCVPTRPARLLPALLPDLRRYRLLHPVYMLCSLMYFPSTFRCATQCPRITGTFAAMKLFLLQRTVRAVYSPGALACVACKPRTGGPVCLGI